MLRLPYCVDSKLCPSTALFTTCARTVETVAAAGRDARKKFAPTPTNDSLFPPWIVGAYDKPEPPIIAAAIKMQMSINRVHAEIIARCILFPLIALSAGSTLFSPFRPNLPTPSLPPPPPPATLSLSCRQNVYAYVYACAYVE